MHRFKNTTASSHDLKFLQARLFALIFLLLSSIASAQLPAFTLSLSATPETCLGNGSLVFTTIGTNPLATVTYRVYLEPDLTTPVATTTNTFVNGLFSGNYTVTATQEYNGDSNVISQQIVVTDQIVLLNYSVTSQNAFCGADGSITITVNGGTAASFEILSGPVTLPPQTLPIISDIPAGVYVIRVYDTCGEAFVVTHTVLSDATQITVSEPSFPDIELPSCNTITATNILTPSANDNLTYPLQLQYTVYPPNGDTPVEISQTLSSGSTSSQEVSAVIPFYYDQDYSYTLVVTDDCGNSFTSDNAVNQELSLFVSQESAECGQFFISATPMKYVAPYNLTFLTAPTGFNPASFNSSYPGPFSDATVAFGNFTNPLPFGDYVIQITDACGHIATGSVTLTPLNQTPHFVPHPHSGCNGTISDIEITLPGFVLVSAVITAAPTTYPGTLDDDVSEFLSPDDGLVMDDLPFGQYHIVLTDDCGNVYDYDFEIVKADPSVSITVRADCEPGLGSIRIKGNGTQILSVIMTSAPAAYTQTMPYDVTFNINASGVFSIAGVPAGQYIFTIIDSCNFTHTKTVNVGNFSVSTSTFDLTRHCGSFDLDITYASTGYASVNLWLQKYNTVTGNWEHPLTGVTYPEGTIPTALNSVLLVNNSNNLNLEYIGDFRILRTYESFNNGMTADFKTCFDVVYEFTFSGEIEITGITKVTCDGVLSDVQILTNGVPPIIFMIITKNGDPFIINNGTNSIFEDLEPALYGFAITQSCGDTRTGSFDLALLPSVVTANQPPDMSACDDILNDGTATFTLSDQDSAILGTQSPANFIVTYHSTAEDAENGANPLPLNYVSGNATVYARLQVANGDCYEVTSFDLTVYPYPILQMDTTVGFCDGQSVNLTADSGFDSYSWSTGESSQTITVSQPGNYTVDVTKDHPGATCTGSGSVTVEASFPPVISDLVFTDWTETDNSITVVLGPGSSGSYLYSLDNIHFQSEPVFTHLTPGPYTVYVKDLYECGFDQGEVYLLNYPHFFTPNADGFNDYWRVPFSEVEPHLQTYIFDRYGKLITGFGSDSPGWDGTLNGHKLPSTDYWFVVIRENGKYFRGHFAMKR